MKYLHSKLVLALIIIAASAAMFGLTYMLFGQPRDIVFYLFHGLGLMFLQVLIVSFVLDSLISYRSKRERLEKLNMVIGAFYSEVGRELLVYLSDQDPNLQKIKEKLIVNSNWKKSDFRTIIKELKTFEYAIDRKKVDLDYLEKFLSVKRDFMLRLIENPNLLEHEQFTGLLLAVFHLTEELLHRNDLKNLPDSDYEHLAKDIKRVYSTLSVQWLEYMEHLMENYPFLFSLSIRTNPFDENARIEVTQ